MTSSFVTNDTTTQPNDLVYILPEVSVEQSDHLYSDTALITKTSNKHLAILDMFINMGVSKNI